VRGPPLGDRELPAAPVQVEPHDLDAQLLKSGYDVGVAVERARLVEQADEHVRRGGADGAATMTAAHAAATTTRNR
jgi:hypothetical protein